MSNIQITRLDRSRLQELLVRILNEGGPDKAHLRDLGEELERATVVEPAQIPADVVTMNSKVRVTDLESNDSLDYEIVFPDKANIDEGRLSILAPVATALLGTRAGDIVEWQVPAGLRKLRVEKILFQPEAAGQPTL